jgi:hypothetical protein
MMFHFLLSRVTSAPPLWHPNQRANLLKPRLADPVDPEQVLDGAVGTALNDPPRDHRADTGQALQLRLTRRVDVDRTIRVLRAASTLLPMTGHADLGVPARWPASGVAGGLDPPPPAIAGHRDRAVPIGAQQRDPQPGEQRQRLGVGMAKVVRRPEAGHGQAGPDVLQPFPSPPS